MNRLKLTKRLLISAALLSFIVPLFYWNEVNARDWNYFNALSLFIRSSILSFESFPIFDPWNCGGINLLANPQNRLFSPTLLFDLALPPYWANLLPMIIYAVFGLLGMYRLLQYFKVNQTPALIGAFLFINSSWFGLHYAEGHIPWGSTQLLPWIALATIQISQRKSQFVMAGLMTLFLLDGNIYGFVFSLLLMISLLIFQIIPKSELIGLLKRPIFFLGCTGAALLASAPKLYPVITEIGNRTPELDHISIPVKFLGLILFSPVQIIRWTFGPLVYQFHEYGCYIGITAVILLVLYFKEKGRFSQNKKWIFFSIFWFWVASGWFVDINPWNAVFQKIPLINNVHIQSRAFLLMWFPLCILLAKAIDAQYDPTRHRFKTPKLIILILLEFLIAKSIPFLGHATNNSPPLRYQTIQNSEWKHTVPKSKKPYHYFDGLGSKKCYEPAAAETMVLDHQDPNYRGEAFLDAPGTARLISARPNQLKIEFKETVPDSLLTLNINASPHWRVAEGSVSVVKNNTPENTGLLTLKVEESGGTATLEFTPWYLQYTLFSLLAGLLGFLVLYRYRRTE